MRSCPRVWGTVSHWRQGPAAQRGVRSGTKGVELGGSCREQQRYSLHFSWAASRVNQALNMIEEPFAILKKPTLTDPISSCPTVHLPCVVPLATKKKSSLEPKTPCKLVVKASFTRAGPRAERESPASRQT